MKVYFPKDREFLEPITIDEFVKWLKVPHYDLGEVIADAGNTVYLITDFLAGESVSGAHLTPSGEFSTEKIPLPVSKSNRKGSAQEKKRLQRAMNAQGLTWNPFKQSMISNDRPEKNYYITIWVINDKVGAGIFKDVDENGDLILYCYWDGKGKLIMDSHYVFGPLLDYAIREARTSDRSEIIKELHSANVVWHGRLKRFEPLNLRRKTSGRYYYIASSGRIVSSFEKGNATDGKRFAVGNYFHTPEEAEEFKRQIVLMRNDQFVGKLHYQD
jgi:hypothetical protein